MLDKNIGFRLKFDNMFPEDMSKMLGEYLELFSSFEIKLTIDLLSSGNIKKLLNICKGYPQDSYSIHLLKNLLENLNEYKYSIDFFNILKKYDLKNIRLVTHFPLNNANGILAKIIEISSLISNNILLLENNLKEYENLKYLDKIEQVLYSLESKKISNVGFCLDIGHLMFGAFEEGISEEDVFKYVSQKEILLNKTKDIHLHDFDITKDHLLLGQGKLNLNLLSNFISNHLKNVPVIVETNIKNPKIDGIKQVEISKFILTGGIDTHEDYASI